MLVLSRSSPWQRINRLPHHHHTSLGGANETHNKYTNAINGHVTDSPYYENEAEGLAMTEMYRSTVIRPQQRT